MKSRSAEHELALERFRREHRLPPAFAETALRYYAPFADSVATWSRSTDRPLVLGVNGCQGSGKTTFSEYLHLYLESFHGIPTAVLSLDDFYSTREERARLANSVHPLLATRGVPGTHDCKRMGEALRDLRSGTTEEVLVPQFGKATDDRLAEDHRIPPGQRVVLLEGWCIGVQTQDEEQLSTPVNRLEELDDPHGVWRRYVNDAISSRYTEIWNLLDHLVMFRAPSFDCVFTWRAEQEQKLRDLRGGGGAVMDDAALRRFIEHYQRLTEHMMQTLPARADTEFALKADRGIQSVSTSFGK